MKTAPAPRGTQGGRSPRRRGWIAWIAALSPFLVLGIVAVAAAVTDAGPDQAELTTAERQELLDYVADLTPLARDGGRVVQNGMKASIDDIDERLAPDAELAGNAEAWIRDLQRVRAGFRAVEPPAFLADAHRRYEHALDGYVATARVLLAATQADGQARSDLVDVAIGMGERSDDVYEQARTIVNAHRGRLHLPLDTLPGE